MEPNPSHSRTRNGPIERERVGKEWANKNKKVEMRSLITEFYNTLKKILGTFIKYFMKN